jgi:hypothetical protein
MQTQGIPAVTLHATDQWQSLVGHVVEVRLQGYLYRRALVEEAMPDASGLWLAADGTSSRQFIDKTCGYTVYTSLYPRSSH